MTWDEVTEVVDHLRDDVGGGGGAVPFAERALGARGTPYVWGDVGPAGYDSGMNVLREHGRMLADALCGYGDPLPTDDGGHCRYLRCPGCSHPDVTYCDACRLADSGDPP